MEEKLLKIVFEVKEVVFENQRTSFAVLKGMVKDRFFLVAVGSLAGVCEGEQLTLIGRYLKNKTYGLQFKVISFLKELPTKKRAIIKFLQASKIKGLGVKTAEKIVNHFEEDTIKVLENQPERLVEVKGINYNFVEKIKPSLENFFCLQRLSIFLQQFNLSFAVCLKIWQRWGVFSLNKIKLNPYCLAATEFELSFFLIDKIAKSLNFKETNTERAKAAFKHVLSHNAQENGHCCVPFNSLLDVVVSFLKLDGNFLKDVLNDMILNGELFSYETNKRLVFLPKFYLAEKNIAEMLVEKSKIKEEINEEEIDNLICLEEERLNVKFAKNQKKAIKQAISNGVFVLTGGPGTGKTTIMAAVIYILEQCGFLVSVCAPTGKAAKRLTDVLQKEATTIHRLLGVQQVKNSETDFLHNERNPLKEDVIVVDEMSMVDVILFHCLLKATKKSCRIILLGDYNQLPCIMAGNILRNLLKCDFLASVELNEIFRQKKESLIVLNAHSIIEEKPIIFNKQDGDFFFLQRTGSLEIIETIVKLLKNFLPKKYGFDVEKDVQVICPCKKGVVGTVIINRYLQKELNPKDFSKKEFSFGFYKFREGDKLLQVKNNYDIIWQKDGKKGEGIFNGEIGKIIKIDNESFVVDFEGKIATLTLDMAKDVEPAFAITVHKSQGSEFKCAVIPVFGKPSEFFSRNLIYTAITRAKELAILVGDLNCFKNMCKQKRVNFRYSSLYEFMLKEKGD